MPVNLYMNLSVCAGHRSILGSSSVFLHDSLLIKLSRQISRFAAYSR